MYQKSNLILFPETCNRELLNGIAKFERDTAESALKNFTELIDKGYDEAYAFVGAIYEIGGVNVDRNYEKAMFYYQKSIETFGAVEAYLGLVRIYYYGLGVNKECCKALEYCRIVLDERPNNSYANYFIGKMYHEGCCLDKDIDEAKRYFKKAWENGYVFGLTALAIIEQQLGHFAKGWYLRIKAGLVAYVIARKNINDPRIREM